MTRQPAPEERHLAALGARVVVAAAMVDRLSCFARAAAEAAARAMDARDAARRELRAIPRTPTREERAAYTEAERAQLTAGRAAYEWTSLLCDWIDIAEHAAEDYSAARSSRS